MNKKMLLSIFLVVAAFLTACGNTDSSKEKSNEQGKLTIYTTVYPLQFLAEEIGGDYANIKSVYPPGANEHTYEPSQKDIVAMAESDLFLYIGYHLEGFVNNAKSILKKENVPVIAVGELATENHDHAHDDESEKDHDHATEEETSHNHIAEEKTDADHTSEESTEDHSHDDHKHGDVDPHVWLDPHTMIHMAKVVKNELIELNPAHEGYFEQNYENLAAQLKVLDQKFADTIENSPKKKIIVSHAAYGYWEKRYGLEQIAVNGLSGSEPTQKELENIMVVSEENDIHYVIFEQNIDSKLTKIIQTEIGAESLPLHNLSVLTDEDIAKNRDYFTIMNDNLETLKTALQ